MNASRQGGELITRPLRFDGSRLLLNFATSAAGSVRVELQDTQGRPIPGFALDDCPEHFGDTVERAVTWNSGSDVGRLAGQPIRVRFVLHDADLYSWQFRSP
ncbi:MAG TPA: hypothetical protein VMM76_18610 [Pirellulaceae bacterium]|nr:hypothetical protein [Pirellulaceae bacterium]